MNTSTRYTVVDVAQEICMRARQAKAPCCAHGKQTGKTKAEPCWACADEASNRNLPQELRRD